MLIDIRKDIADEHYWRRNSRKYGSRYPKENKRKYRFLGKGKLLKANTQYHSEINKLMNKYSIRKIFLLTDSEEVVEEYREKYDDMVVCTSCKRLTADDPAYSIENPVVKRRRGIEVIKMLCLLRNATFHRQRLFRPVAAISRIKDWPEENISPFPPQGKAQISR